MATPHKLICPLPTQESAQSTENANAENILWDLGKATKRGTKKCSDCGYVNGIRSYMCKNSLCNRILKATDKHKVHIDAIKLVTVATRQIYSVRVREKGSADPDQRGFVQLPCAIYSSDKLSEVALCFVNNCERSYSILKCHENDDDDENENLSASTLNFCVHIESAVKSLSVAHAIDFKHDLINNMKVCDDVKKKLCSLAKSTEGPLVQRIAKNVMAIKCFVNSAHPLGYLHFVLEFKRSTCDEEIDQFHCECNTTGKCLHYYACICAFASDAKLANKYSSFVQHEFDSLIAYDINTLLDEGKDNAYPLENIRIEILRPDLLGLPQFSKKTNKRLPKDSTTRRNAEMSRKREKKVDKTNNPKKLAQIKILSNDLIHPRSQNDNLTTSTNSSFLNPEQNQMLDMLSYEEWMLSVIERINYSCDNTTSQPSFFNENILDDLCSSNIVDIQEVKIDFQIPEKFFEQFKRHLYFHTRIYPEQSDMSTTGEDLCASEFCAISTKHFAISDVVQLEQLFSLSSIKLLIYQLVVNEQWPFRICWTGGIYKQSKFGELLFTFIKRTGNR